MVIDIDALCAQLESIRSRAAELEARFAPELADVHPEFSESARNLIHYVALRQIDVRGLQDQLTQLGLSSLGRAEQHVMASVQSVINALQSLRGKGLRDSTDGIADFEASDQRMVRHTGALLGPRPAGRDVHVMVTLPTEAAQDYQLVRDLIETGMDTARINCSHDIADEWQRMIVNIERARMDLGVECRIVMDLAGPKLRTGDLVPGPQVLAIRPRRDAMGRIIAPKRLRFFAEDQFWPGRKLAIVPVPQQCIEYAQVGDEIRFVDTRGRKRTLHVVETERSLVLEAHKRAYIATGTKLRLHRKKQGEKITFRVGELPAVEQPIVLHVGDSLILETGGVPGEPARYDSEGSVAQPAHVSCHPAEALRRLSVGATVLLNDGKIEGVVESTSADGVEVRVTRAKPSGSRLRSNRSINFPDSDLQYEGLTDADKDNLAFIVERADAVGVSFVRKPEDLIALQDELRNHPDCRLGIIPKIETEQAFNELPRILLAAMRWYPAGVMIARGDLAVECGWERLAEIQEEILWLCEAAQVPVIWATQVLEGEAKKGLPTRAEITDAAMSQRAECVMLNKGPHILSAISMLDDILRRMQGHQHKKSAKLRKLGIAEI